MRPTAQIFWSIIYKLFPLIRDGLLFVGIIRHGKKRQPFSIGYIMTDINLDTCRKALLEKGFEKNILAWVDNGEVLSMRKADPIRPHCHYHIRIFENGEVCGHYEKMPEKHPIDCLFDKGMENRSSYFCSVMAEFLVGTTKSPFTGNFASHKSQMFSAILSRGPSNAK